MTETPNSTVYGGIRISVQQADKPTVQPIEMRSKKN